jgi:hypothetical protein
MTASVNPVPVNVTLNGSAFVFNLPIDGEAGRSVVKEFSF